MNEFMKPLSATFHIVTAARSWEMDNDVKQSLDSMPRISVDIDMDELVKGSLDFALTQFDQSSETVKYYSWSQAERYVSFVPSDVPQNEPVAWIANYSEYIFAVDVAGRAYVEYPAMERLTWADLRRGRENLPGRWDQIVIVAPMGMGDGSPVIDLTRFAMDHGVEYFSYILAVVLWRMQGRRNRALQRRARRVARDWQTRHFSEPWALRQWFESQPEWRPSLVAKRLNIPNRAARQLLTALGYQRRSGATSWVISPTQEATDLRGKWIDDEWGPQL